MWVTILGIICIAVAILNVGYCIYDHE